MMKLLPTVAILGVIVAGCDNEPVSETKHEPVIHTIHLSRTQIYVNEFITVQGDVSDEDKKDVLTYQWKADAGLFTNAKNNPTQWHAPADPGAFQITLQVSDGFFVVEKSTSVKVIKSSS